MSMRSVYDTPPDGDFARYVEELGQQSAARMLQPADGVPATPRRTALRTALPAAVPTVPVATAQPFAPLRQVLQVGVVLWLAYLIGSLLFPPLAVIGWPLLLFFAVGAYARLKSLPWSTLAQAARAEAASKIRLPSRRP